MRRGCDASFWRHPGDRAYDYVEQMARRGHVSITHNCLGYGNSSRNDICFGTEASALHQVVQQLRDGGYQGDVIR